MPDLHFRVSHAEAVKLAVSPQIAFTLEVEDREARPLPIQSLLLRVQIRIEPTRRRYDTESNAPGLRDLFGSAERWGSSMRSMLWTHADAVLGPFTGRTTAELHVACSYDFNLAATKYFEALDDGEAPLCFLFSGTVFSQTERGLQASQISWEREAEFRLSVQVWKDMMAHYYPNVCWLCLDKGTFDRLYDYKSKHGLPGWEQAVNKLLEQESAPLDLER